MVDVMLAAISASSPPNAPLRTAVTALAPAATIPPPAPIPRAADLRLKGL